MHHLVGILIVEEAMGRVGSVYRKSLFLLLNFAVNVKWLLKMKSI